MAYKINDVTIFEKIVLRLNNITPRLDVLEKPSLGMILRAIVLMKKAEKLGELEKVELGEDVWKYIAVIAFDDGHILLPEELKPALPYLKKLEKNSRVREQLEKMLESGRTPKNEMELNALARYNSLKEYGYGTK